MGKKRLADLAKTIRSKNAGVNQVTFDIVFEDAAIYERVKRSGGLTKESVARYYGMPIARISHFVEFDAINAIKFTIYRAQPSGGPGESDVLGCQQYGPLLDMEIPWE
ncbi:MAG: DUF4387 domain-containing protein [Chloroflexota bacterium]